MVLTFIAGFAATFGTAEGIRAAQNKSRREEHRSRKNNLVVHCAKGTKYSALLEGRRVVLAGSKLYIDTGTEYNVPFGHPFEGYFLPYPAQPYPGLVSTITHEAPIMNWVFVHAGTHELKFGPRAASEGNATGPWDCTRQDKRLTFSGWEGFCAVKEGDFWALYFDRDGDGLEGKVGEGTPVVEVGLWRAEMRVKKPVVEEMSEEEKAKERERSEAEAKEQAERAAAFRAQEEVLREAIMKAQEEADRARGGQGGSGREPGGSPQQARQGAASPRQVETHPEQQPESPRRQVQPQSKNGRGKSRPHLNLASPASKGHAGGTNNENTNRKRNGRGSKSHSSNASTPTSQPSSTRSESGSEPSGRQNPAGANAGRGRGARGAENGNAAGKGARQGNGRNGRSSGSSDATPSSSGRSSPPSSYPSDKELPPSPDVD